MSDERKERGTGSVQRMVSPSKIQSSDAGHLQERTKHNDGESEPKDLSWLRGQILELASSARRIQYDRMK